MISNISNVTGYQMAKKILKSNVLPMAKAFQCQFALPRG